MYIVYVLLFKINYFALIFFQIYFKQPCYPGSYSKEKRDMQELEDLFLCDTERPFIFNMWGSLL